VIIVILLVAVLLELCGIDTASLVGVAAAVVGVLQMVGWLPASVPTGLAGGNWPAGVAVAGGRVVSRRHGSRG
jgi:hypothetical protein